MSTAPLTNVNGSGNPAQNDTTAELDAASIVLGWEALARRRPRQHAEISWGARSDIGRARENNEDKFDFFLPDDAPTLAVKGRLWAVADGMGGHNAGQIASEAALKSIIRAYFADPGENVADSLRAAIAGANALIFHAARQFPDRQGMGTTVLVAVAHEDTLTLAHVGDSRAYLLRDGSLRLLTDDHSWVEEQVKRGSLTREEAQTSPYRNVITRSIGIGESVQSDILTERLREGDVILLCSDGLSGFIDEAAIRERLERASPSAAALALIDAANDAGGRDNITALVLTVRRIASYPGDGEAAAAG